MNSNGPIAHVAEDGRVHLLSDHLHGTAERAAKFAAEFGCAEWGQLAGLWHDLGKYSDDFQKMIRAASGLEAHLEAKARVDHSTAGGLCAVEKYNQLGRVLAYLISGHHAGLPDWQSESSGMGGLAQRLQKSTLLKAVLPLIPPDILNQSIPTQKPKPASDPALWIRMLFSCVVDADFLDTEAFFEAEKAKARQGYSSLEELMLAFTKFMKEKQATADETPVNRLRAEILSQCIAKAARQPGIFTLSVPTGGGKTLSSMAFALHHAEKFKRRRIIYVIPYTSIIEQTANQFRQIFNGSVVEHHSNLDVFDEKQETSRSRLACENWDAPIVVTTSVQFFESLFASRTSRCRKLHNIVNSVVVLDEAQILPPEFLKPILCVLQELQKNYGVTLVLSTATQPALGHHQSGDYEFTGLSDMVEIIDDPISLHAALKRVEVLVPVDLKTPKQWDELASELQTHPTTLCIVNRRDDCRELYQRMPEGTIHLSALMCGAHRSDVITLIKERLKEGIPTRVISTQLIEAGVDLDFPVVYRALAGLDSIAQAAGRCNREGRLDKGRMVIFAPPSKIPPGHLRQASELGRQLLVDNVDDPLAPERFERFFKELYWLKGDGLDKYDILSDLDAKNSLQINFRTAAGKFHIIDEATQAPVIVKYDKGAELVDLITKKGPERWLLRKLQRYVVNLPRYIHTKLLASGAIREIHPGIYVQGHAALYHPELGFQPDKSIVYDPDELIS